MNNINKITQELSREQIYDTLNNHISGETTITLYRPRIEKQACVHRHNSLFDVDGISKGHLCPIEEAAFWLLSHLWSSIEIKAIWGIDCPIKSTGVYLELQYDTYHIPSWHVFDEGILSLQYTTILENLLSSVKKFEDCHPSIISCENAADYRMLIFNQNRSCFDLKPEPLKPFVIGRRLRSVEEVII